ncbi:hypothetical protein ACFLYU_04925 [Candidatus Dependentiae bacterium]
MRIIHKRLHKVLFVFSVCLLFASRLSFCMKKITKKIEHKKTSLKKVKLCDSDAFCQIIAFLDLGSDANKFLLGLRSKSSFLREAVSKFTNRYWPICLVKDVNETSKDKKDAFNFDAFVKWLKAIDFCIAIDKSQRFLFSKKNKRLKECSKLLRKKLKGFTVFATYDNAWFLKNFRNLSIKHLHIKSVSLENVVLVLLPPKTLEKLHIGRKKSIVSYARDVASEHFIIYPERCPKLKVLELDADDIGLSSFPYLDKIVLCCPVLGNELNRFGTRVLNVLDLGGVTLPKLGWLSFLKTCKIKHLIFGQYWKKDFHDFESFPKSCQIIDLVEVDKEGLTGKNFKYLPKTLKKLKVCSLKYVKRKFLKDLPKALFHIYVSQDLSHVNVFLKKYSCDLCNKYYGNYCNSMHIMKKLKEMKIVVKSLSNERLPKTIGYCDCVLEHKVCKISKDGKKKYKSWKEKSRKWDLQSKQTCEKESKDITLFVE